ncbi:hypothetical protein S1OALGB6SA_1269 [Olavius algarvensis spirochete endosymbiont]|nr:hypothetical protein S1OALGB6SA_1269 [Olavius algarvensis spirochete endosymbiont]
MFEAAGINSTKQIDTGLGLENFGWYTCCVTCRFQRICVRCMQNCDSTQLRSAEIIRKRSTLKTH